MGKSFLPISPGISINSQDSHVFGIEILYVFLKVHEPNYSKQEKLLYWKNDDLEESLLGSFRLNRVTVLCTVQDTLSTYHWLGNRPDMTEKVFTGM